MWAVGGHSSWLGAQTSRVTGPRPGLVPTPPAQGENTGVGSAARLSTACRQIPRRYALEGEGGGASAGRHRGSLHFCRAGLHGKCCRAVHLPNFRVSLGCHPHPPDRETEALGIRQGPQT